MTTIHRRRAGARLRLARLTAAALLFAAVGTARADLNPNVHTLFDQTYTTGNLAMAPWMTSTGWDIREVVMTYNSSTDTLDVDIKTTGIAGDADGSGDPGGPDPRLTAVGGSNPANLQGRDSITVAFESANSNHSIGSPVAIAGVPEYKVSGSGLDGFELAQYVPGNYGLQVSYGNPITTAVGTLSYSPSAANPDFEFTIQNFSKLYGLSLANGFYFSGYAGSPDDVVVGEDKIGWTYVSGFQGAQTIGNSPVPTTATNPAPPIPSSTPLVNVVPVPEPTSVALFGLGGVLGLLGRRRIARSRAA